MLWSKKTTYFLAKNTQTIIQNYINIYSYDKRSSFFDKR